MENIKPIPKADKPLTEERAAEIIDEVFNQRRFSQAQWKANLNKQSTQQEQ
tara:strand:- start:738 stop:890 length:153 start_codon:yes stop_codon:yes gene_type:complete